MFDRYLKELLEWNKKFNLTSITDPEEIRKKHFEDSLLLLQIIKLTSEKVIDIGTGAGFPGVPLKIVCPGIRLTLVEATRKKADFLKHLVSVLSLQEVEVIWGRAEEIAKEKRESFDIAVSRAVAKLSVLCELCLPFVRIGGIFVAYKEENINPEVEEAKNAVEVLGGSVKEIIKYPMRSLVVINKIKETPLKYPRRAGMAKKRPL